jgi:hypothetical protein
MLSETSFGSTVRRVAGATILIGSVVLIAGAARATPASARGCGNHPEECEPRCDVLFAQDGGGIGARVLEECPEETTSTTQGTTTATPTTAAPTTTVAPSTSVAAETTVAETTVAPAPVQVSPAVQSRELAYTDSGSTMLATALGLAMISVGAMLLAAQRRRFVRS